MKKLALILTIILMSSGVIQTAQYTEKPALTTQQFIKKNAFEIIASFSVVGVIALVVLKYNSGSNKKGHADDPKQLLSATNISQAIKQDVDICWFCANNIASDRVNAETMEKLKNLPKIRTEHLDAVTRGYLITLKDNYMFYLLRKYYSKSYPELNSTLSIEAEHLLWNKGVGACVEKMNINFNGQQFEPVRQAGSIMMRSAYQLLLDDKKFDSSATTHQQFDDLYRLIDKLVEN